MQNNSLHFTVGSIKRIAFLYGMTTRESFEKFLSERGVYQKLGIDSGTVRFYLNQIKEHGKFPSIDKMMKLLEKGGFCLVKRMKWK